LRRASKATNHPKFWMNLELSTSQFTNDFYFITSDAITSHENIFYLLLLYGLEAWIVGAWTDLRTNFSLIKTSHSIPNVTLLCSVEGSISE